MQKLSEELMSALSKAYSVSWYRQNLNNLGRTNSISEPRYRLPEPTCRYTPSSKESSHWTLLGFGPVLTRSLLLWASELDGVTTAYGRHLKCDSEYAAHAACAMTIPTPPCGCCCDLIFFRPMARKQFPLNLRGPCND